MERPSVEPSPGQTGVSRWRRTANAPPRMSRLAPASPPTTAAVPASSDGTSNDDPEPGVAGAGAVARSRAVVASPVPITVAIAGRCRGRSVASSFPGSSGRGRVPGRRARRGRRVWRGRVPWWRRRFRSRWRSRGRCRGPSVSLRRFRGSLAEAACLGAELVVDAGCGEVACHDGVAGSDRGGDPGSMPRAVVSLHRFRGSSGRPRAWAPSSSCAVVDAASTLAMAASSWPGTTTPLAAERSGRGLVVAGMTAAPTAPLLPPPPPSRTCPDAVEAINAAEEDAAATSSTTRASRAPRSPGVRAPGRALRGRTRASRGPPRRVRGRPRGRFAAGDLHVLGSPSPDCTERVRSRGASDASASSISSRGSVGVAASGRTATSSVMPTSIAAALVPLASMQPPW